MICLGDVLCEILDDIFGDFGDIILDLEISNFESLRQIFKDLTSRKLSSDDNELVTKRDCCVLCIHVKSV